MFGERSSVNYNYYKHVWVLEDKGVLSLCAVEEGNLQMRLGRRDARHLKFATQLSPE